MFGRKNKSEQRGTLMVEAIAMLGLIAIVTPTLYKKSAERLQEIQDINIASQARTMAGVIETFVRNKASVFQEYTNSNSVSVFELCKNDDCKSDSGSSLPHLSNYLNIGYSAAIPYGFKPQEVKYFGDPRVFVVSEEGNIVFYVVYPKQQDLGKRRATRLASLIGAQGGIVESAQKIQGTGGAWELDSSMIKDINFDSSLLLENSLVLTNSEPISTKFEDTDKFLYRIPATDDADYYHNTMVTDLYLGANREDNTSYSSHSYEYYSIFNVRKMTLNTDCSARWINKGSSAGGGVDTQCDPDVADLYIGKPTGRFNAQPQTPSMTGPGSMKKYGANTGAAWIYGNLSALNDRFRMWNTSYDSSGTSYERKGYDILQFAHEDTASTETSPAVAGSAVFMASNKANEGQVAMIDGMVRVVENFNTNEGPGSSAAFLVGGDNSSLTAADGRLITAFQMGDQGRVYINGQGTGDVTRINSKGGDVYINGLDSASTEEQILARTFINQKGGELVAGKEGQWLYAGEIGDSAHVDIFSSQVGLRFTVGGKVANSSQIWSDKKVTALRDGAIRAYKFDNSFGNVGGVNAVSQYETGLSEAAQLGSTLANAAVLGAKYTDVLGSTYLGMKGQMEHEDSSSALKFSRDTWRLGVAGSAWVDELLYANEAWFNSTGIKELHAGFSTFAEFKNRPRTAWLNAYQNGVLIRNRAAVTNSSATEVRPEDARFYAGEDDVYLGDSKGAMAHLRNGIAELGYANDLSSSGIPQLHNMVGADSERAFVAGNQLAEIYTSSNATEDDDVAVDIQKGAMLFQGHSWKNDSTRTEHDYSLNTIDAHAGQFAIHTRAYKDSSGAVLNNVRGGVFYANSTDVLTRLVDFSVQDTKGEHVLKARPMIDDIHSSEANVEIDGSFHVTGNRVIHVASAEQNAAGGDAKNQHAMFEVDPSYVRVLALDGNDSTYVDGKGGEPLAMFEVNPYDIDGSSTVTRDAEGGITDFANDPTDRASVYIRRGAIELERSHGTGAAADSGYGYIKANRLVSNAEDVRVPTVVATTGGGNYDQYMVNPAYTSVMHDIKLTTRGGARLSDILPDYVLKGVYNVSNDYLEDGKTRIRWSCGSGCKQPTDGAKVKWASPYVGVVPYAVCPPGYRNMATIVPISFQMGQAGEVFKPETFYGPSNAGQYVVNPSPRQAKVLSAAKGAELFYPTYEEVETFQYNKMVASGSSFKPLDDVKRFTAGWFLGPSAHLKETGTSGGFEVQSEMKANANNVWAYAENKGGSSQIVAEPLYFQQNTYLKTTLTPKEKGWDGRMGFLYDTSVYTNIGSGLGNDGILSNNNPKGYNDSSTTSLPFDLPGTWVWNLFPVPTNTLEGHATVYCYFDRTKFKGGEWDKLVDPIDQMNNYRDPNTKAVDDNKAYIERLNDPTLKYSDPW